MANQPTAAPTAKVTAATLGAAAGAIAIYIVEATTGLDLPAAVEGAVVVLGTFGAGYLTPSRTSARHLEEN